MKRPIWQVLILTSVIALAGCAKKTEEATAAPAEEKEVPMSADPAEPEVVVVSDAQTQTVETVVPEAFAQTDTADITDNAGSGDVIEAVEIDETADTATQDAEVQED